MSAADLVSVLVPCRDSGRTLPETLASVFAQTHRAVEIIVVDDGSSEAETLDVLQRLPDGVRVVRQEGRGLPAARNRAFREARGPYLLPLDADDLLEPGFIERCLESLRAHPQAGFVYTDIQFFGERTDVHRQLPYNFHDELFRNQITVCALIRREAWEAVEGYREELVDGAEDWEFWIALGERGWHGVLLPEPLFRYRVREGSLSTRTRTLMPEITERIRAMHPELYSAESIDRLRKDWKGFWNPRDPEGLLFRLRRRLRAGGAS